MRACRLILCALLLAISVGYVGKGMAILFTAPAPPADFELRWKEVQYFLAGRDPNDSFFSSAHGRHLWRPLWTKRDESPLPALGPTLSGGYPPWAFPTGVLYCWPTSITAARRWFAGVNALALTAIFLLGYRLAAPHGLVPALTLGASGTAMSANCTTLGIGQYGIIVVGQLVLCLWALSRGRAATAGMWLGLAAAKPILSAPFGLAFLLPWRLRALLAVAGVLLVANALAWWQTGAPPLEMVAQMLRLGQAFAHDSYGPMNALTALGVPLVIAEVVTAVTCTAAAALLIARWKEAPVLIHFAIAAVAARLWSYHHLYDNLVLVFLLIALGDLANRRPTKWALAAFLAVGLSLWAPGKWNVLLAFQIAQILIWIAGLAVLLAGTPRRPPAAASPA
jgi:hypothetical protein